MKVRILTPDGKIRHVSFFGFIKKLDSEGKFLKWALVSDDGERAYLEFPEMILLPIDYDERNIR